MYTKLALLLCLSGLLAACGMKTPEPASTPNPTATPVSSPTPAWERAGWNLVWQDEFEGTELNLKNWTFDIGGSGWGNQELQAYTNRPENVRLEQGMLVIEARQEPESIDGRNYSSARLKTQGLHDWQYGRIEARLKSYGPTITVLAIEGGTRADERDLHRTFRPYLAKGREWYEPAPIIMEHIANVVEREGPPWFVPEWTTPRVQSRLKAAQPKPTGISR